MWIRAWNYTCRTLKFAHNKFFSKKYLKGWRNEKIDTQKNTQSTLGEVEHETFFASNGNSEKKIRAPDGEDQKSASFINDLPLWETRDGVGKSCLFSQATLPP